MRVAAKARALARQAGSTVRQNFAADQTVGTTAWIQTIKRIGDALGVDVDSV
jgi:hypothetical protein